METLMHISRINHHHHQGDKNTKSYLINKSNLHIQF